MIDPRTKINGEEFEAYNRRRWGGSGWTNRLRREGQRDGAHFSNWKWWPHTLRAHQLVHFAKQKAGVHTVVSHAAICRALYEEGKNPSDVDVLMGIAHELGLVDNDDDDDAASSSLLRRYLQENEGADDVLDEIDRGRAQYQISGVPFFLISAEGSSSSSKPPYALSGAQSPHAFLECFELLLED